MIATLEYVEILDRSELLGQMIIQSDVMEEYMKAKLAMENNKEAQQLIKKFSE
ncbi:YlbF family regulator, partial [Candidatus Pseudothioglobus singularis]|nr:YlbF family regulator [Candidatus Pseudothioglobus singularis]